MARQKRQLKNYLINRKFQLKYAGMLVSITALLSLVLGVVVWRTSSSLVHQSQDAVKQGQKAVSLGQVVAEESKKVSAVVEMNIVKDPFYADNPELLDAFKSDSEEKASVLTAQQKALEAQAAALNKKSETIEAEQSAMLLALLVLLGVLVVAVGIASIVVTHKVAGPVFKMTRQIRELSEGHWKVPDPLRKGDELVEFHGAFEGMVKSLRERREGELEQLDEILAKLADKTDSDDLKPLVELRSQMDKVLQA